MRNVVASIYGSFDRLPKRTYDKRLPSRPAPRDQNRYSTTPWPTP